MIWPRRVVPAPSQNRSTPGSFPRKFGATLPRSPRESILNAALMYMQNADAIAFALLGVVTAVSWLRRRDRSLGFLALAIVLLSLVTLLGRIPAQYTPPFLPQISLILFMGSGYALLRFRRSLIPLQPKWHAVALVTIAAGTSPYFRTPALVDARVLPASLLSGAPIVLILASAATILQPTLC